MVDVGTKPDTHRVAIAEGPITMYAGTLAKIILAATARGDVASASRASPASWAPSAPPT